MKKTYYLLSLDSFGQPDGNIEEIKLTLEEYKEMVKNRGYIYENYSTAVYRACD